MPIYEYECQDCHGQFEIVQKFSDKPKRKCESCGGKLKKLLSAAAFHLKGSGWYATDYASSKPAAEASKPSETTDTKTPTDSKSDTDKSPKKKPAKNDD